MRSPGPEEPTGRGLQIVNMLSERWGVEHASAHGKTVWFTVPTLPRRLSIRAQRRQATARRPLPGPVAAAAAVVGRGVAVSSGDGAGPRHAAVCVGEVEGVGRA